MLPHMERQSHTVRQPHTVNQPHTVRQSLMMRTPHKVRLPHKVRQPHMVRHSLVLIRPHIVRHRHMKKFSQVVGQHCTNWMSFWCQMCATPAMLSITTITRGIWFKTSSHSQTFLRNLVPRFPIFFGLCFLTQYCL